MNKIIKTALIALCAVMLLSLAACGEPEPLPAVPEIDPAEFTALEERLAAAGTEHESYAYLVNASVNGETVVPVNGETLLHVEAELPEDSRIEQWTVNGVSLNTLAESVDVTVRENAVIRAELRPLKKVTCINCSAQFLNAWEDNGGESFTEFVFEDEYVNTFTGMTENGGSLLLHVEAPQIAGKILDHWLVNGQALSVRDTIHSFNAYITEATTFEPVYIDKAG